MNLRKPYVLEMKLHPTTHFKMSKFIKMPKIPIRSVKANTKVSQNKHYYRVMNISFLIVLLGWLVLICGQLQTNGLNRGEIST